MQEQAPEIVIEESQSYVRLILNRPHVRNAITTRMWQELPRLIRRLQRRRTIRALLVSGAGGKAFASGADLSELPRLADAKAARAYERVVVRALDSLVRCPLPAIAMIRGYALGSGCHLAAACDLRVAGESAQLGIPAARLGAGVNPGVVARLVSLVGPAAAKEMLFSGQPIDARRALQVGLVNYVVPDAELEGFTLSLTRQISNNAPLTIQNTKRAVNWIAIEGHRRPPQELQEHFAKGFSGPDFQEGLAASLARRQPHFVGR